MNNDEIIQMLRELSESAEGRVKSKTIRIPLEPGRNEPEKKRGGRHLPGHGTPEEAEDETEEAVNNDNENTAVQPQNLTGLTGNQADDDTDYLDEEEAFEEDDFSDFSIIPSQDAPARRFQRTEMHAAPGADRPQSETDSETGSDDKAVVLDAAAETEDAGQQSETAQGRGYPLTSALRSIAARFKQLLPAKKQEDLPAGSTDEGFDAAETAEADETEKPEPGPFDVHETVQAEADTDAAESAAVTETEDSAVVPEEIKTKTQTDAPEQGKELLSSDPDEVISDSVQDGQGSVQAASEDDESVSAAPREAEAQSAGEQTDDSQEAEISDKEAAAEPGEAETPADKPVKKSWAEVLRTTPTEEADFEQDAHLFRSQAVPEEEAVSLRERLDDWKAHLADRGIGKTQMIIAGVLLCVLIIALIAGIAVYSYRAKRANITSDDGLQLTVEHQPSAWTSSGEVTLGIRANQAIQSVKVNDETFTVSGETSTQITLQADQQTLQVTVTTQESTLNGTVTLHHVDGEAPDVRLSQEDGLVSITAEDTGSGTAGIYYGILTGRSTVPAYQLYTEPFAPEQGSLYAYYAVDHAGNTAGPYTTDMTQAVSLTLERETLTLFPGDTYTLHVGTQPEHAFLNQLTIMSSDPAVVSVSETGELTAMAEGTADITVSAEGLASLVCSVDVRTEAEVTISAVGDVTLGDDINFSTINSFSTVYSLKGESYFFDNVRSVFQNDGITFANLEGTLTDQGERQDKTYAFRGDPSYVNILKDGGVDIVTLANNHSSDYGEVSLSDTQKYLSQAGIDYVRDDIVAMKESGGVRVGFVGIYCLNSTLDEQKQLLQQDIDELRSQNADAIVVAFHWGEEKAERPSDDQIDLAHTAVEYGADLVVGHHPHVLQGIEIYQGKYIAYSLGNFCFGGNSDPSDKDTIIFQQTFRLARGGGIETAGVNIIPCSISSDASSNNYQPTPATGSEAERIMEKINSLSAAFGTAEFTYSE